ncbi:DEKNAAC100999 [Brettanomyces naardenensis]|uniref:DEKNAAC100999 n=1 Tax=Brettanomyces naardenensis TaxID=13370 RepID=A0A448YGQ2_BRENA|nr:DEKNAAC100999 [Brettanomyces naardenensis]
MLSEDDLSDDFDEKHFPSSPDSSQFVTIESDGSESNVIERANQISLIEQALSSNDKSVLRQQCLTEHGLIMTSLRSQVWPILTGCMSDESGSEDGSCTGPSADSVPIQFLSPHRDESQVQKDVDRSYINYPEGLTTSQELALKERLKRLIVRMLREVPELNYYQGYHDVAAVATIIFEEDQEEVAFEFLYNVTLRYLRDHMLQDLDPTIKQLSVIPELLKKVDYGLWKLIGSAKPVYALSAVISLFAHEFNRFADLCLLWDAIFAERDPSLVLYVYVAAMVRYKDQISDDLDTLSMSEGETSSYPKEYIHAVLGRLISKNLNGVSAEKSHYEVSAIIRHALEIKRNQPLSRLRAMKSISKYSCLKNAKASTTILSLQCAEEEKLIRKRRRKEGRRKRRLVANSMNLTKRVNNLPLLLKVSVGVGLFTLLFTLTLDQRYSSSSSSFRNKLVGLSVESEKLARSFLHSVADGVRGLT